MTLPLPRCVGRLVPCLDSSFGDVGRVAGDNRFYCCDEDALAAGVCAGSDEGRILFSREPWPPSDGLYGRARIDGVLFWFLFPLCCCMLPLLDSVEALVAWLGFLWCSSVGFQEESVGETAFPPDGW